jgi:uncharacterized protein with PIN domain
MNQNRARFRFYEELNDFLPRPKRKDWFDYHFSGNPLIKSAIESLGIPHTEIDLILVNGESVDFFYQLKDGDWVSVYPVFESFDISKINRLRPEPLREPKFIVDVHLGKLAKYLRLLGFDTLYHNDYSSQNIAQVITRERRIVLTRNRELLKMKVFTHGYWVRATKPKQQIMEVMSQFDLYSKTKSLQICLECNGKIVKADKSKIIDTLPSMTREIFHEFHKCTICKRIYWQGSHYRHMLEFVSQIQSQAGLSDMK